MPTPPFLVSTAQMRRLSPGRVPGGGDDVLAVRAVLAAVLGDMELGARAGGLDADEHGHLRKPRPSGRIARLRGVGTPRPAGKALLRRPWRGEYGCSLRLSPQAGAVRLSSHHHRFVL
jgi:hypothetical protein